MRFIVFTLAVFISVCSLRAAEPDRIDVSDDAIAALKQVQAAYEGLRSLEVHGTITSSTKFHSLETSGSRKFDGLFVAPNKFRIEIEPRLMGNASDVCGCTGKLVYSDTWNHSARIAADAGGDKLSSLQMLIAGGETANVSPIALAVFKDWPLLLVRNPGVGTKTAKCDVDEKIGDTPCLKIVCTETLPTPRQRTLYFDRNTNLLRREIDETQLQNTASSREVIDVESTKLNPQISDEKLQWKLPVDWVNPNAKPPTTAPAARPAAAPGAT